MREGYKRANAEGEAIVNQPAICRFTQFRPQSCPKPTLHRKHSFHLRLPTKSQPALMRAGPYFLLSIPCLRCPLLPHRPRASWEPFSMPARAASAAGSQTSATWSAAARWVLEVAVPARAATTLFWAPSPSLPPQPPTAAAVARAPMLDVPSKVSVNRQSIEWVAAEGR